MATCNDCIHYGICTFHITGNENEKCPHYTPTTDVVPKSEEGAECPICHGTGRIGTTNWLTKNMTKKQIAEKKAKAIAEHERHIKAEVAREIFEEIYEDCLDQFGYIDYEKLAELKKKYTEELE